MVFQQIPIKKSGSNFFQQKHRTRRAEVSSKQVAVKIRYEINQDKKGSKYIDVNSFATHKKIMHLKRAGKSNLQP